jgi:methionine synthase II (cobalamin-independent)
LGEAVEAGLGLLAGAADVREAPTSVTVADRVRTLWHRLSFPAGRLPRQVVVTPSCGLAGVSDVEARAVLAACRDDARRLTES